MNLVKKIGSVFSVVLLFSAATAWAKSSATVRIEPNQVEVGERFAVNIEVRADDMASVERPTAPPIQGAQLIGTSSSQRINSATVTNDQGELEFKTVQTQVYTFVYQAAQTGSAHVPSVKVKLGSDFLHTPVGTVKIVAQGAGGGSRPQKNRRGNIGVDEDDMMFGDALDQEDRMANLFNQLLQRQFGGGGAGGFQAVPQINEKDAFVIVAEVDKTQVYEGEQITASWYLYTRAGVREIDTLKYPELKGFWKEDIEQATLLNFQPSQLNNLQYNRAILASYALFPIEDGKAVIDPYRAKVTVVSGFGQAMTLTKNSESIPILVKPLPKAPDGILFSGAVGEFQVRTDLESPSVVAHQPFVVKVHVEGRGNAKQFELPNLNLPPEVEVYDIKKDSKYFKTGMSYKAFEIFLIPRKEGELVIPAVKTTVFNPKTEKYEEVSTQEIRVNVMPGSGQQAIQASRVKGEGGAAVNEDQLHILTQWSPQNRNRTVYAGVWSVLFVLAALGLLAFAAKKLEWFKRPANFKELFAKRLQKIDKALGQKKWREVGVEATNLSYFVLGEISGQGGANLEVVKLLEKSPPSVRREIGEELKNVMNKFYLLGFGPDLAVEEAIKSGSMKDDIKRLEKLLWKAIELSHADIPK